jgi:hypothetical protein
MCYMLVLSTDSDRDLTALNSDLVAFSKTMPNLAQTAFLQHRHYWYLGSCEGCSCGFRHLERSSASLGFGEPEDWFPEDAQYVTATMEAVIAFRTIVADGAALDCIDAWASDDPAPEPLADTLSIDLGTLPATHFRFFEGHRFVFSDTTSPSSRA